jgi:hypothetical protein
VKNIKVIYDNRWWALARLGSMRVWQVSSLRLFDKGQERCQGEAAAIEGTVSKTVDLHLKPRKILQSRPGEAK